MGTSDVESSYIVDKAGGASKYDKYKFPAGIFLLFVVLFLIIYFAMEVSPVASFFIAAFVAVIIGIIISFIGLGKALSDAGYENI